MEGTEPNMLETALQGVSDSMNAAIGEALPLAGAVFATIVGILMGFKLLKKITGVRS